MRVWLSGMIDKQLEKNLDRLPYNAAGDIIGLSERQPGTTRLSRLSLWSYRKQSVLLLNIYTRQVRYSNVVPPHLPISITYVQDITYQCLLSSDSAGTMDPLSITTSILALLGACNTASRTFAKLRALRHASAIIDSLNNDITEIEVSLDHIDDYIDRTKSDLGLSVAEPAIIRKCTLEMDRTQDKILEVSKLLNHRILKHHDDGSSSVRKFQFYNAQKQLAQFHDEFRNARQRIISLFVQLGVTEAIKIEVLLKELVFARDESRADMLDGFSTLAQGQQRMETAIEGISQLLQSHQVPTTTNHDETSMALRSEISTYESVGLSVARVRRQSSERRCFCPLKPASRYLHSYLGRLFMGYVISPTLDSHQPKCTCKASAEVTFVYFFPTWFLNWVAAFGAQFSQLEGLRFSFFIIPVVSHDHVIWDLINAGDTEKMHLLFSTRQVSVRSTNSAGYGLLRVRNPSSHPFKSLTTHTRSQS